MVSVKESKFRGVSEQRWDTDNLRRGLDQVCWDGKDSLESFLVQTICFFDFIQYVPFKSCFDKM